MDGDKTAEDVVAVLRGYAGTNPLGRRLSRLAGEPASCSNEFTRRWAGHDVTYPRTGRKVIRRRAVGEHNLGLEALPFPDTSSPRVLVYRPADDGARGRLRLLESWAATKQRDGRSQDLLGQP